MNTLMVKLHTIQCLFNHDVQNDVQNVASLTWTILQPDNHVNYIQFCRTCRNSGLYFLYNGAVLINAVLKANIRASHQNANFPPLVFL